MNDGTVVVDVDHWHIKIEPLKFSGSLGNRGVFPLVQGALR